ESLCSVVFRSIAQRAKATRNPRHRAVSRTSADRVCRPCRSQQKRDGTELSDSVGGASGRSRLSRSDGWTPDGRTRGHQQAHYIPDPHHPAKRDPQLCGSSAKAAQISAFGIAASTLLVLQSPPKRVLVSNGSTRRIIHAEARTSHSASRAFLAGPRRPDVDETRLPARHSAPAFRRSSAGDDG